MYIVIHRQNSSELFSVAKFKVSDHTTTNELRWLMQFLGIICLANSSSSLCLHLIIPYRLPESSILFEEPCIMLTVAVNSFARELNTHIYIYI